MTPRQRSFVVAAILLSMFMSAMEATVVATAMPTVVADLRGIELYGWVGSIYMLASTVTIPLWGSLADLRGRRPAMIAGIAFFLLGSLMAGAATSMPFLVLARAVQGVGAGSLQPVSMTIVGDLYTVQERGRVQGAFGALWGVAGMAGPLLGGLIVRALSWRWVFYINLPFGLLSAGLFLAFYRDVAESAPRERRLDVAGASALTVSILALLLGVGGTAPWLTLPLALAAGAAFVAIERRAPEPVLPLQLLTQRTIAVSSIAGAFMGVVMMSTLMFLPLYAQATRGASPTEAGTTVAPMLLGWPLASTLAGRALARVRVQPLVRAGLGCIALGTAAVWLLVRADASPNLLRLAMFVFGAGMGLANISLLLAVQESVGHAQRGIATATSMFARSIGGAVSVGAMGALLAHRLAGTVDEARLNTLLGPEHGRGLAPEAIRDIADAVARGMLPLFALIAFFGLCAALTGVTFPDIRLNARGPVAPPVGD